MLEIKNVSKTFNAGTINEKRALTDLSLSLNDGDFVTVIGGNGAGKSTLLNAVAGVWPVDSGSILIDGEDVTGMPEYKRAKYIGRVFQDPMMGTSKKTSLWPIAAEENADSNGALRTPNVRYTAKSLRPSASALRTGSLPRSDCYPAASVRR